MLDKRLEYIQKTLTDIGYSKPIALSVLTYLSEEIRAKNLTNYIDIREFLFNTLFEHREIDLGIEMCFIENVETEVNIEEKQAYKLWKIKYDIDTLEILFNETRRKTYNEYKKIYPELYNKFFNEKEVDFKK